jgi:hypothetical protein
VIQGGGGVDTLYSEHANTCDQEFYLDLRLFNGTVFAQSRLNALAMVENFGELYQTITGFDNAICVRYQLDCTPFAPAYAINNVDNHQVLSGDLTFLSSNYPNITVPKIFNSAVNPELYLNPYPNSFFINYNVSTSITRVYPQNNSLAETAYQIDLVYDFNATQATSPPNTTLSVNVFRNFCGLSEDSPLFIGRFTSDPLSRDIHYKDQSMRALVELDQSVCGQNIHFQIVFQVGDAIDDLWLTAITYNHFTSHGDKVSRALCIQYYVDCTIPVMDHTIPVAPGYEGLGYETLLIIAGIGYGVLLLLAIIIDGTVGCLFGPYGK